MLAFNSTSSLKGFWFSFKPSKRIKYTKGFSYAKLKLIYHVFSVFNAQFTGAVESAAT